MTNNQSTIIGQVLMQVKAGQIITEVQIEQLVAVFAVVNPLTPEERTEVIRHLHTTLAVRMDRGACVKEKDHKSWYYAAKKTLPSAFWDRYRLYLHKDKGFNSDVIDAMDSATDEMMDLLGNLATGVDFQRRGLVIGDVQSGKTSTYTALMNKAADAGYRVIILLTGTIEKLRRQTQQRIDYGFVGLDSSSLIKDKQNVYVGVGDYNPGIQSFVLTSTTSDFNKSTATRLNGKLASFQDPVLFVIKKNKSILEKLEQWLRTFNAIDGKIMSPMLLIDDEADNASVNTKKGDDSPTAINANIRKLLKLFTKANYVGFTATPFANIFIDPDSTQEMLDDDLFPRDFIYALEPPTNYIGAESIFAPDAQYSYMLKGNDDCETYLPERHKKDFIPDALPNSLKEAIVSFFITNAIRDLRRQNTKHRSMLVNISRFIDVQNCIQRSVDGYVRELQREIKNYYLMGVDALKYESFAFIKSVFDKYYSLVEYSWDIVQQALNEGVASIVVRSVNGGNAAKNLNYDECEEEGLRLIAIGGFSLSRGLTLEGLSQSYFYRNSKMYDTLMQMGRWFGYRDGYDDLCQVWMGEESMAWYSYITTATEELKREVRRMQDENKTPKEFGLCVRSDIRALLVTARNKMRSAKDYTMSISLNGRVVETPYIPKDKDVIDRNMTATVTFFDRLKTAGYPFADCSCLATKYPQILNVPQSYIIDYLNTYKSHYLNADFHTDDLINIIKSFEDDTTRLWTVAIATGKGSKGWFCGKEINFVGRCFAIKENALQMSGKGSRLGNASYAKAGLNESDTTDIEKREKVAQEQRHVKHAFSQELYFISGLKRNPLLIVYPIELKPTSLEGDTETKTAEKIEQAKKLPNPIVGLGIGIPRIDGRENKTYQYKINLVMYKELLDVDDDYEETDPTVEEDEQ